MPISGARESLPRLLPSCGNFEVRRIYDAVVMLRPLYGAYQYLGFCFSLPLSDIAREGIGNTVV